MAKKVVITEKWPGEKKLSIDGQEMDHLYGYKLESDGRSAKLTLTMEIMESLVVEIEGQ